MLFLIFQLRNDRYAIEASRVVEVLPLLELKRLPQAPKGVAGIFNLRGRPIPAIDLSELAFSRAACERLTTRIIVINHTDSRGKTQPLGLIAEHVTQTLRREPGDFLESGVRLSEAPYLGPVFMDGAAPIQWLYADKLLSEPIRELLSSGIRELPV
ncbi:MAG TPA: chemotaxis protein CheW [Patescibacteria group bacterium]|nr:chemotaxis protein CheW [Patescibacteria group bacterium]